MTHHMKLTSSAFAKIAMGSKTIELRLNDDKRQKINVGDTVVFNCNESNDIITAKVKQLYKFADFKSLYDALPLNKCGYIGAELNSAHYTDMGRYYREEQIKKYGALGIELCEVYSICDVKDKLSDSAVLNLLAPSVFNPTPQRLNDRAEKYSTDKNIFVYACKTGGVYVGIIIFKTEPATAEILDIAVKSEYRGYGIARKLIDFILNQFAADCITAETDDEAVEFYKKCGFAVTPTGQIDGTRRYFCKLSSVSKYYDLLIGENNDPVHDPKPLRDYMDNWDGQAFIDSMELDKNKSVFEIGVGTGRLAVRVAPLCGQFYGIDISPKTIERAKENLFGYENVKLICDDFLACKFERKFDVIYSSLTFMHIKEKQTAINKVAALLKDGGKFVLSIDKNQNGFIDTGTRKITVFPDTPAEIKSYISNSGLLLTEQYETEFSHIFAAKKKCK